MEISDIRIALMAQSGAPKPAPLLAYLDLVLDDELVIHNLKLIEGRKGIFLCMPGKERRDSCPTCNRKNSLQANFCNHCGTKLASERINTIPPGRDGRVHLFQDIVHPITADLRDYLLRESILAFEEEKKNPGSIKPLTLDTDNSSRDGVKRLV